MKNIAILGSGLAGLLAAKAIRDKRRDWDIKIFTKSKELKRPKGFVLLHDKCNVDGIDESAIKVVQKGRENKYKNKLNYNGNVNSSWKSGLQEYYLHGWNIRKATELLHKFFESYFTKFTVKPNNINNITEEFDYVISTIPPDNLTEGVILKYSKVYIKEIEEEYKDVDYPVVYYHGDDVPGTRVTMGLWGKSWIEYGKMAQKRLFKKLEEFRKPTYVSGAMPKAYNLILAGRNGLWNKNILAHQVYYRIKGMIDRGEIA